MSAVAVGTVHGVRLCVGSALVVLSADEARGLARALTEAAAQLECEVVRVVEAPGREAMLS